MLTRFLPIPPLNVPRETEGYRLRNAKDYLLSGNKFDIDVQATSLSSFLQNITIEHQSDIVFDTSDPVIRAPQKILLKASRGTSILNTYIDIAVDPPIKNNTEFIEHTHPLPEHTHPLPEHIHYIPGHGHAPSTTDEGQPADQTTGPPQMLSIIFDFIGLFTDAWQPYFRKAQWWIYNVLGIRPDRSYGN